MIDLIAQIAQLGFPISDEGSVGYIYFKMAPKVGFFWFSTFLVFI